MTLRKFACANLADQPGESSSAASSYTSSEEEKEPYIENLEEHLEIYEKGLRKQPSPRPWPQPRSADAVDENEPPSPSYAKR